VNIELSTQDLDLIDALDGMMYDPAVMPDTQREVAMRVANRIISKVLIKRLMRAAAREEMECLK
jgi:hypothetical protein